MILSCGDTSQPAAPAAVHRDCLPPIAPSCSHLAIVTPHEAMSGSDTVRGQLLVMKSGVYAFDDPALLQRYEIDGLPPRLHATSNVLMKPPPSVTPLTTDGDELFGAELRYDGQNNRDIEVELWNAPDTLAGDYTFGLGAAWGSAAFAAFQGLAILRLDALTIIDGTGAVRWTLPQPALEAPLLGTYGCGFIAEGGDWKAGVLTTIPLDGRSSTTQGSPPVNDAYSNGFFAWPYDPHGVVFVTQPIPTDPNFDASKGCTTSIDLLFDDGRAPIHHERVTTCGVGLSILSSSLGAVVVIGDQIALLDANADIVGDPIATGATMFVPIGDYIAATGSDWSATTETTSYWETVIGCGP